MLRRTECFDGLNVISDIVRNFTENTDTLSLEEKEKNYLFAIELTDCIYSMMNLAILYENTMNYGEAAKYYEMALRIDDKNVVIRYNYACMYVNLYLNKIKKAGINIASFPDAGVAWYAYALHHLSFAADLNDSSSMLTFIRIALSADEYADEYVDEYYCATDVTERVIKYLSMLIEHHDYKKDYCVTLSQKREILHFCDELHKDTDSFPKNIINEKNRLRNDRDVSIYINKIRLFTKLNHICECQICYDESLHIDMSCGHCFCTSCYVKIHNTPCPICKL